MSESNVSNPIRIAELHATGLLDSEREEIFDRFTRVASRLLKAPVSLISLVEEDRQFFKSQVGLTGEAAETRQSGAGFCRHVVESAAPLVVSDARIDERVKNEPLVSQMGVVAYLGVPITVDVPGVAPLGSFCVIDSKPRDWTDEDIRSMEDLVESVNTEIRLRSKLLLLDQSKSEADRYVEIVQRSADIVVVIAPDGRVTMMNHMARAFVGIAGDTDIESYQIKDFHSEEATDLILAEAIPCATREGVWIGEVPWRDLNGETVIMSQLVMCHRDVQAEVEYYSLIARDITEQIEEKEELVEAIEEAEDESKAKSSFLANMSHELRTPLNAVLGFSELLGDIVDSEKGKRYINAIHSSGEALLDIINDILDLSKIESGRFSLHQTAASVEAMLREMELIFCENARMRGLGFEAKFANHSAGAESDQEDIALEFDMPRVRQILFNFTSNALKFTTEGKVTVEVDVQPDDKAKDKHKIVARVIDTGIGIPKQQYETIFLPFQQANAAEIVDEAGTGLGLTICRKLARMMGGDVTVKSKLNEGSTFTLIVPNLERAPIPSLLESKEDLAVRFDQLKSSRILAVDDHPYNLEVISGIFEGTHHKVFLAKNGKEAIERAQELAPDMILMDIRMPVMDGSEANEIIKSNPALKDIPVIAVTASSLRHQSEKLRRQFDGYVRKPFTRRELFGAMEAYLAEERRGDLSKSPDPEVEPELMEVAKISDEERIGSDVRDQRLDDLAKDRLEELRKTQGIRAVQKFAEDIQTIGQRSESDTVMEYARSLIDAVDGFKIDEIERLLKEGWDKMRDSLKS